MNILTQLLFLIIGTYTNLSMSAELNCNFEKVTGTSLKLWGNKGPTNGEKVCEAIGYINLKDPAKPDEWTAHHNFQECVKLFDPYFKEIKVEETDLQNFGKYCKDHNLKAKESHNLLTHLKQFCWKMSDIGKLPFLIDYKMARITPEDWNNLQFDNMQLQLCFSDVGSLKPDEKIKDNKIHVLQHYIELAGKVSKCSCAEIIGLENIYNTLNRHNEYKSLKSLYEEVCVNGKKREKSITKEQMIAISKYDVLSQEAKSSDINLKKIVQFITTAEPIFTKGWYTEDDKKSQWPLTYLIKNSQINNEFNMELINTMAEAIYYGYSADNYDEFIKLTSTAEISKTIGTWDCRKELLSAFNLDKKKQVQTYYISLKYENRETADQTPNRFLKLFLDLIPPSTSCNDFVKEIKVITNKFYGSAWDAKEMFTLLASSKTTNKSLGQVSDCMLLAERVRKEMCDNKSDAITKPDNVSDSTFESFRRKIADDFLKKLFEHQDDGQLCKNPILDHEPKRNKVTILKIFQTLYSPDKEVTNLNEIFKFKTK